ncbi:hypothetical protein JF710_22780 [Mycobacterium intracellulare]|uniref:hypothetical protein n=1 Tax=Mycobacterium intracellulare TaxID=1767 RepID=UPI001CDB2084|nr:hypothetical protein [Mycobacterium intracellulare]MCA2256010.1 hypothetical protein [Mycobacterium intracellulare]
MFIPAGKGSTDFLDARDAAEVAALARTDTTDHHDKIYHLTGPAALNMDQVASALTDALGSRVTYTHPGLMRFAARLLRRRGVGGTPSVSWPRSTH